MQNIILNNGESMPLLGFGTFQITDAELCKQCVTEAIESGYRLFDTAASYGNEEAIGEAISKAISNGIVAREELCLATKVWIQDTGYEATMQAFQLSLKKMRLDYLDLYLIHHPFGDYYDSWRAMEDLVRDGRIKSIGVCNFASDRLVDLCFHSQIKPAVNQIEIHPFLCQKSELNIMKEYDVQPMAWGPLSEGQHNIFKHPVLAKVAEKYGKTESQIVLRWHMQRGIIAIPKTVHKKRMIENMDIWDFELNNRDIQTIEKLDIGHSEIIDHRSAYTAKWLNEWNIHEK